jgi:hypothetical protein
MKNPVPAPTRASRVAVLATTVILASSCGGEKSQPDPATAATARDLPAAQASHEDSADAPDTSGMESFVLAKINANPAIDGKATLVEFRQKSVAMQPLGDKMKSAVVEFEGVVRFSADVSWSWQGPTKAGEPQKFEARAEYVDHGQGWQLVEPLGIYPL